MIQPAMSAALSTSAMEDGEQPADQSPSGMFVICSIVATFVLFAGMFLILLQRAATQRAPTKAVIVQGDERFDNVSLTIDGPGLAEPLVATLDKSNKYVVSFFLDPGVYTLTLTKDGKKLRDPWTLGLTNEFENIGLDLTRADIVAPTTAPATQPKVTPRGVMPSIRF